MDILSKEAIMAKGFFGERRFLSNFHICEPFMYNDIEYTSTEAAFQAQKSTNQLDRMAIAVMTPVDSKNAGKKLSLRPGWDDVRVDLMMEINEIKFQQPALKALLLATGDDRLVEYNWWNDVFWGVCNGFGKNHLGNILMHIRSSLKT